MLEYIELVRDVGGVNCFMCGDFNLDLLHYENSNTVQSFVNSNFENSFYSVINKPTRVRIHSATVIDHIWCNFILESQILRRVLLTDISDHFAVFVRLSDLGGEMPDNHQTYSYNYRSWEALDDGSFCDKFYSNIADVNLDEVLIDQSLSILVNLIKSTIDEVCPLRLCTRTAGKPVQKPWMTNQIKLVIQEKNRLHSKYCRRPVIYGNQYRLMRNRLNNLLRQTKCSYYQNLLFSIQNDSKKTWNVLNLLLNRNSKKSNTISEIEDNNTVITDLSRIYNVFSSYFAGTPSSIASTLPQPNSNFDHYLTGNYPNSFFLAALTPTSIRNIVSDLKSSTSGGHNS